MKNRIEKQERQEIRAGRRSIKPALKCACLLALTLFTATPAHAMTVRDFEAKPATEQAAFVADFIEKMTADIGQVNPALMQAIRDYFTRRPQGRALSEGVEKLYVELGALDLQAQKGNADLSRIQLETIIVWIVKQKFPPPAGGQK